MYVVLRYGRCGVRRMLSCHIAPTLLASVPLLFFAQLATTYLYSLQPLETRCPLCPRLSSLRCFLAFAFSSLFTMLPRPVQDQSRPWTVSYSLFFTLLPLPGLCDCSPLPTNQTCH